VVGQLPPVDRTYLQKIDTNYRVEQNDTTCDKFHDNTISGIESTSLTHKRHDVHLGQLNG